MAIGRIHSVHMILYTALIFIVPFSGMASGDTADEALTFYVNDPTGRNSVVFKSEAPLEDIVGTTSAITGFMTFDPNDPQSGGHGEFRVPAASLDSGIPLRDQHLRGEAWLNAAEHPMIVLAIDNLTEITEIRTSEESQTYDVVAEGTFTLHGVTTSMEIPGRITFLQESEATAKRLPGHILAARSEFAVTLSDYGITGAPGVVGSKVGETIDIEVSIMGSTGSEKPAME